MEPKTKREANEHAFAMECEAENLRERSSEATRATRLYRDSIERIESKAARLRALLPTLPD